MKLKSQEGQSIVEFALILPLLLIILFGVIEFSILLYDKAVITNASREGARYGIVAKIPRYTESEISSIVQNYCSGRLVTFAGTGNLSVSAPVPANPTFGQNLTVTVNYTYTFLVIPRFLGLSNSITMQAATVMKYE